MGLSPCIMCAWAIEEVHGFGLRHCVILDSSFEGAKARLEALPDMKIVSITHPDSVLRMRTFGRRYPWDWQADIGEILPRHAKYAECARRRRGSSHRARLRCACSGKRRLSSICRQLLSLIGDLCNGQGRFFSEPSRMRRRLAERDR